MEGRVVSLTRYPIKGLSGEPLNSVDLTAGTAFPCDRVFAFRRPHVRFDEARPAPLQKTQFYMLARDAELANLSTRYDEVTDTLTIASASGEATFVLSTPEGVAGAEEAIAAALGLADDERPRLTRGGVHRFTDVSVVSPVFMNAISLINAASVRSFEGKTGHAVDVRRFRGNVVFEGWPAWSELQLEGSRVRMGEATLKVLLRTQRCAATTVNPDTAERDVQVPKLLTSTVGHMDMGVYAEVIEGGTVRPGDTIELV